MSTIETTQPSQKIQRTFSYACHICGLNGHKMTDCPKFAKIQKMFDGKCVTIIEVQHVAKTQTITTYVNVVDVNVTIISKTTKEQVFKDREPRKTNSVAD
jgi:transcription elongation factor Elf1